jgi:hypothetical protein
MVMKDSGRIEYVVGQRLMPDGAVGHWTVVVLGDDETLDALGRALLILWEHQAVHGVDLWTGAEWSQHATACHWAVRHIDHDLEVLCGIGALLKDGS